MGVFLGRSERGNVKCVIWVLLLIAHSDELCGLAGFVGVDDRDLVGDDANGEAWV